MTRSRAARLALILCALCPARPAPADTITLKDGTRLDGDIERVDGGFAVTTPDGKTMNLSGAQIKSVEVKPPNTPGEAKRRLESLRRAAANVTDPRVAISRYGEYLKQFGSSDAAGDARRDLAEWEDRLARKMTRAGGKWVTPEELGAIQEQAQAVAMRARDHVAAGRLREATPLIQQALDQDPHSSPALFLRAVVLFRQDQLPPARKAFEAVLQELPDHGPTLNNLAVICWRQDQYGGALKLYDAALVAAPGDPHIVDNVAEALHALPKELRESPATRKLVARFQAAEDALRRKLERRGLYRWGSTWVEGPEMDRLQSIEREVDTKIKDLQADFNATLDQIKQIDRDAERARRDIRSIEASSYGHDAMGRVTRLPYPRVYYELMRDLENLKRERAGQEAQLEKLRKDAKAARQELPVPRYTGTQHIIEVEGTPLIPLTDEDRPPAPGAPDDARPRREPGLLN